MKSSTPSVQEPCTFFKNPNGQSNPISGFIKNTLSIRSNRQSVPAHESRLNGDENTNLTKTAAAVASGVLHTFMQVYRKGIPSPVLESDVHKLDSVQGREICPSFSSLIDLQDAFKPFVKKPYKREIVVPHRRGGPLGVRVTEIRGKVCIAHVWGHSLAWRIGLTPGDRIESINGESVRNALTFVQKFKSTDGPVTLSVYDCPKERLHIHSHGKGSVNLGIVYSDWKLQDVIPNTAAAESGLCNLKDTHSISVIDDALVLGLSDDEINKILNAAWKVKHDIKITLIPYEIAYEVSACIAEMTTD